MFLLCHCYVFALQQLILYFLMVFVANSLQIAYISSFLQAICNKNHRKNEETQAICKLFATKTIRKVQNQLLQSKNKAMTQQKHSKPSSKNYIFQILLTIQNFAMFLLCFCFAATNSILFDGFCCKQLANSLCFFIFSMVFVANSLQK